MKCRNEGESEETEGEGENDEVAVSQSQKKKSKQVSDETSRSHKKVIQITVFNDLFINPLC
ncbi:hypothetical protein EDC96DRAFT_603943 [Choanephora cucurbitarum]|nr:hypothetical protein EDC96DRAFT_603943 [Choanephora cucurbitarum]